MPELGLDKAAVRGYEAYMEGRALELGMKAGRREWETKWKELRRGWYMGGEGFMETLRQSQEVGHGRGYFRAPLSPRGQDGAANRSQQA